MGYVTIGGVPYADGVEVRKGNRAKGKQLDHEEVETFKAKARADLAAARKAKKEAEAEEVATLKKKKPEAMSADRSKATNMTSRRANAAARDAAEKESSDG